MEKTLSPSASLSAAHQKIHEHALSVAESFRRCEVELMEALIAVDQAKIYLSVGYPSLFQYVVSALRLSEAVAYNAIAVARKANRVPSLRQAIQVGSLSLSKARKVLPVLDSKTPSEDHPLWVEKAVTLSTRKLERAVAIERPQGEVAERAVYRSKNRLELSLGVSESLLLDFRHAQNLVCRSRGKAAGLEETLGVIVEYYLERKDPERRTRRVVARKGITHVETSSMEASSGKAELSLSADSEAAEKGRSETRQLASAVQTNDEWDAGRLECSTDVSSEPVPVSTSKAADSPVTGQESESSHSRSTSRVGHKQRTPIPVAVIHQVRLRDRGSCQAVTANGKICGSRRWLDFHHRIPVRDGGSHTPENLVTLCRAHHQAYHRADRQHQVKRQQLKRHQRQHHQHPKISDLCSTTDSYTSGMFYRAVDG